MKLYMVFDVESVGLHGEGFAVGYVVVNGNGERLEENAFACPPDNARGEHKSRLWVMDNVPAMEYSNQTPSGVRNAFWLRWLHWKAKGALLVADCNWPVEARFLAACVDDSTVWREWEGPYPLHDLASILLARKCDPLATNPRLPDEVPEHHPLNDARQSARLLLEALHPAQPGWTEYPVILKGVPGFSALKVPYGTDPEVVKAIVAALPKPGATFHE